MSNACQQKKISYNFGGTWKIDRSCSTGRLQRMRIKKIDATGGKMVNLYEKKIHFSSESKFSVKKVSQQLLGNTHYHNCLCCGNRFLKGQCHKNIPLN
jgi:hypothetical protein